MKKSIEAAASNNSINVDEWELFFSDRIKRHQKLVEGYIQYLREMSARDIPAIFETDHLAHLLGIDPQELAVLTLRPELQYRSFTIPKKSGGERTIRVPWPHLLACQRWINAEILRKGPAHSVAHGYVVGRSNITNAKAHLGSRQILCIDIKDFFGSITSGDVQGVFYEFGYPANVCLLLEKLCTLGGCLPQGAASSPALSNLVMRPIDDALNEYCVKNNLIVTRYVDDITISGNVIRGSNLSDIDGIIVAKGFKCNAQKTRFQRGKRKIVTGLSIGTGSVRVPRKVRREFRNDAVIALRSLHHGFSSLIDQDPVMFERVLGKLNYWSQVEPTDDTPRQFIREIRKSIAGAEFQTN